MEDFDITRDDLLTAEEICNKLSISRSTFDRWRKLKQSSTRVSLLDGNPRIPFPEPILNIGRSPRWSANDVNAWVKNA